MKSLSRQADAPKTEQLCAHLSVAELATFRRACAKVGFENDSHTLRCLMRAFAEHVNRNGFIRWPVRIRE